MAKTIDKLKKYFSITVTKGKVRPAQKNSIKPVKFKSETQQWLDWYIENCFETRDSQRSRENRYKDLEYMLKNNGIIQSATDLYANEATQADVNFRLLSVNSKNQKFTKRIYELFDKWEINQQVLNDVARNLTIMGDSYWINNIDMEKGIESVTPIDVLHVIERIDYNPADVAREMETKSGRVYDMTKKNDKLSQLAKEITKGNCPSKLYRDYLFGFELSSGYLLPWEVTHFRLYTTKSEFKPYGRSMFINAVSPYRQLQAALNLMSLARANKFPKEIFYIKTHEAMTESDQWEAVNQAKQQYKNMSVSETDIEAGAISEQYFLPEGVVTFDLKDNNIRLNDILDIEILEQNLMRATGVPLDYMYSQGGGFTSGIALSMQSKPFARRVFFIQTAILKELTQLIKTHFIITGEFDIEKEDFELYMNYPNSEDSREKQSVKSDSLRLAKDIIDNLGQSLGLERDEALPIDVVRDVFSKYTFLPPDEIEEWIKMYQKEREEKESESDESGLSENRKREIRETLNGSNKFQESYFDVKKASGIREGIEGDRHFYNSYNSTHEEKHIFSMINGFTNQKLNEKQVNKIS